MIALIIIILGISILLIYQLTKKKPQRAYQLLIQIHQLIQKDLNLDDSTRLIEISREFLMIFIHEIEQKTITPTLKEPINKLLGLILQIPRIADQDLMAAIHQINRIQTVSLEIKQFFKEYYSLFYRSLK
ncbi:MAG: hypothetical protein ACRC0X_01370 [Brevinema sp.]